jgi:hypothetical protein
MSSAALNPQTGKSPIHEIPQELDAKGVPPKEIVYCQLSISTDDGQISLHMPRRNWVFHHTNIEALVKTLQDPDASEALTCDEIYSSAGAKTSCDIAIKDTCYVVLELTGYANWRFHSGAAAVHMADEHDESAPDNWGLMHVDADGSHSSDPVANSQIAYFRVSRRAPNSSRPFNFNVEIEDKDHKRAVAIIIDPDTTNTGQVPPPLPS